MIIDLRKDKLRQDKNSSKFLSKITKKNNINTNYSR